MFSLISFIDSVSVPLFSEDMWNGAIGEMAVHDASTSRAGKSERDVATSGEIIRKKAGAIMTALSEQERGHRIDQFKELDSHAEDRPNWADSDRQVRFQFHVPRPSSRWMKEYRGNKKGERSSKPRTTCCNSDRLGAPRLW